MTKVTGELNFTECNNAIHIDCHSGKEVCIKIGGIWLVLTTKQATILRDKLDKLIEVLTD